jgi:hypothetical protein
MTIKEAFYQGIQHGDWQQICQVYKRLTGEEPPALPAEKKKSIAEEVFGVDLDEEVDEVVELEKMGLVKTDGFGVVTQDNDNNSEFYIEHGSAVKQNKRAGHFVPLSNTNTPPGFVDDGSEFDDERVDKFPDNIILGIGKVRERKRKCNLVDVKCAICGKQDKVSPILADGYDNDPQNNVYRCTHCQLQHDRSKN